MGVAVGGAPVVARAAVAGAGPGPVGGGLESRESTQNWMLCVAISLGSMAPHLALLSSYTQLSVTRPGCSWTWSNRGCIWREERGLRVDHVMWGIFTPCDHFLGVAGTDRLHCQLNSHMLSFKRGGVTPLEHTLQRASPRGGL